MAKKTKDQDGAKNEVFDAKEVSNALDKGNLVFGLKKVLENLREDLVQKVIISKNCPQESDVVNMAKIKEVEVVKFSGTNIDLGEICGKPFSVSVVAIKAEKQ